MGAAADDSKRVRRLRELDVAEREAEGAQRPDTTKASGVHQNSLPGINNIYGEAPALHDWS